MLESTTVTLAVALVVQRKREKNQISRNNQKQPTILEIAKFEEVLKEIENQLGSCNMRELESELSHLVKTMRLHVFQGGFATRKSTHEDVLALNRARGM